jgi:hypothetical protein
MLPLWVVTIAMLATTIVAESRDNYHHKTENDVIFNDSLLWETEAMRGPL